MQLVNSMREDFFGNSVKQIWHSDGGGESGGEEFEEFPDLVFFFEFSNVSRLIMEGE